MKRATCPSYPVSIFIAGDFDGARDICRAFCDEEGLCVTVTPTTYVYTKGEEAGVVVGLINYPRFPSEPSSILMTAKLLALELMHKLEQESVSVQTPDETLWFSVRLADRASDTYAERCDVKQAQPASGQPAAFSALAGHDAPIACGSLLRPVGCGVRARDCGRSPARCR
jgi:hypothetical protein